MPLKRRVDELKEELEREGYRDIFLWTDRGGAHYPTHCHQYQEVRIILEGEMIIVDSKGRKFYLKGGDRLEVPAGEMHEAYILTDCTYLCGSKY
jgi:mannose-6-phosphate isomerase-like protein (cupin superfamily)